MTPNSQRHLASGQPGSGTALAASDLRRALPLWGGCPLDRVEWSGPSALRHSLRAPGSRTLPILMASSTTTASAPLAR